VRLFIAVHLPTELTDRAAALLPAALPALKRVKPELMHVTLAFLGWTPDDRLGAVNEAARAAAAGHRSFDLSLAGAGRFPLSGRPRVV
jgi:RNA 2',3'-cyclic 3'-phosphodiesterase